MKSNLMKIVSQNMCNASICGTKTSINIVI